MLQESLEKGMLKAASHSVLDGSITSYLNSKNLKYLEKVVINPLGGGQKPKKSA